MEDYEEGMYDEVEIEDMEFDYDREVFVYPCPCGDKFFISIDDLENSNNVATCPSCTLKLKVIYDMEYVVEFKTKQLGKLKEGAIKAE